MDPGNGSRRGRLFPIRVDKAQSAGLTYRPLLETVADTLAWARTRPADYNWRAGLSREREAELLKIISRQQRRRSA